MTNESDQVNKKITTESNYFLPYIKVPFWVIVIDISTSSKIVYQYLYSMNSTFKSIYPSMSQISTALRISKNTARSALEELKKNKLIEYDSSKGHSSNRYKLPEIDLSEIRKLMHKDFHFTLEKAKKKNTPEIAQSDFSTVQKLDSDTPNSEQSTIQKLDSDTPKIGAYYDLSIKIQNNDDNELRAKGPSSSSEIENINSQKSEEPNTVLKERWSHRFFGDILKSIIVDDRENILEWFDFNLVGNLHEEICREELVEIISYARRKGDWIKSSSIGNSDILRKKVLSIRERMNGVPKQPQGETKIDLTYNFPDKKESLSHGQNIEESIDERKLPDCFQELIKNMKK